MSKATGPANRNIFDWRYDEVAYKALRKGLSELQDSFSVISNKIHDPSQLLEEMLNVSEVTLSQFVMSPGGESHWEYSSIMQVKRTIEQLIGEKYTPSELELDKCYKGSTVI